MKKLWLLLLLFPSMAFAQDMNDVLATGQFDFTVACRMGNQDFSIAVTSPSKAPDNDDMLVRFQSGAAQSQWKLPQGWYFELANGGNVPTPCRGTKGKPYPLFQISDHTALMLLKMSDRPNPDVINAVLFDFKTGEILDNQRLGEISARLNPVLKTKDGYKIALYSGEKPRSECGGCEVAYAIGWKEFFVQDNHIATRWLTQHD